MNEKELEGFAKLLIEFVRDRAIDNLDSKISPDYPLSPIGKRWDDAIKKGDIKEVIKNVIADAVDITIFYTLYSVDEKLFDIKFKVGNINYDLGKEFSGELAGYYSGGWIEQFSKERHYEDNQKGEDNFNFDDF